MLVANTSELISRVSNRAMKPVTGLLVRLWGYPAFSVPLALWTDVGITAESAGRSLLADPSRESPTGPLVRWSAGGSGPALLLLNGFTADGNTWPSEWIHELEKTHRVIRVDNRGTGRSRRAPSPFHMADLADDAAAVLDACAVDSAIVLGLSMGGMIAQELAIRHPRRVEKLVLTATIPPIPAWVASDYGVGLAARMTFPGGHSHDIDPGAALDAGRSLLNFSAKGFAVSDDELRALGRQVLERPTQLRGAFMQARAINGWWNASRLATISAPTVVVHGLADRVVPIANARRLAQLIPDVDLVEVPGCGHMVPWESPQSLIEAVRGPVADTR